MSLSSIIKDKKILNKVADVTIFFWLIKIISTTMGESSADFLSHHFGFNSFIAAFIALLLAVVIQMRFKRYIPWMYWTVIVLVAIFGTMLSDRIHHLGVPLLVSTTGFLLLLLLTLWIWYRSEKTLDMKSVHTPKRELFYWIVILFTFALGTAAGDLVADTFHFGLLDATLAFGVIMISVPIILYLCHINKIALFWITYILTRPFGAAGADLLAKPAAHGGYGLGDGTTSILCTAIIVVLVVYLTISHRKAMLQEEMVD